MTYDGKEADNNYGPTEKSSRTLNVTLTESEVQRTLLDYRQRLRNFERLVDKIRRNILETDHNDLQSLQDFHNKMAQLTHG